MTDPVVIPETGQTYERAEILKWFGLGRNWDPMTNTPVNPANIKPNYALKSLIDEWRATGGPAAAAVPASAATLKQESAREFRARSLADDAVIVECTSTTPIETVLIAGIDQSGSMAEPSVRATSGTMEASALTRLDLVKHCLRIMAAMAQKRGAAMGIVGFSDSATVALPVQAMDKMAMDRAEKAITDLRAGGSTNMWAGLRICLEQAATYAERHPTANIHVMFLTDGEPTEGYLPMAGIQGSLKKRLEAQKGRVTVSCFGFGYNLDSKLMEGIAVEGGGTFGLISDGRMAGTNIINYCATALATAAAHVELEVGAARVPVGNIQIGVPRTVFLPNGTTLGAQVSIRYGSSKGGVATADVGPASDDEKDNAKVLRRLRAEVAKASRSKNLLENDWSGLQMMLDWIGDHDGGFRSAVMEDIQNGTADKGQLLKAVSSEAWFRDWGLNHLLSYGRGLACQQCLNFKDAALQFFAGPLFKEIQAEGNELFDNLPAPTATGYSSYGRYSGGYSSGGVVSTINMSSFNQAAGGCFAGNCLVEMATNNERKYVSQLRAGDVVRGGHRILCVVRTRLTVRPKMVRLPGLDITEWHPIRLLEGGWRFPCELGEAKEAPINAYYNLVLESGHTIRIGNYEVCTLGHGFTDNYVIRHPYFGTQAVVDDLRSMPGWNDGFVELDPAATRRSPETGLICGI
jgi:Mg-chelatase subunit ChlD